MSIQSEIDRLQATKASIKNAIISKGQPVADTDTFASYPEKIRAIETGKDVSAVTAGAGDVLAGKKIVDKTGAVITGTIPTKTAADLTTDGATVTAPSGYYGSAVSKTLTLDDFGLETEIWVLTYEDGSTEKVKVAFVEMDRFNFTINGETYTAEEQMTWGEWCASGYNTMGLSVIDNNIGIGSSGVIDGADFVLATDVINADYDYEIEAFSAGGGGE